MREIMEPNLDRLLQFITASVFNFQSSKLTDDGVQELNSRYKTGNDDEVACSVRLLKVLARKPEEY